MFRALIPLLQGKGRVELVRRGDVYHVELIGRDGRLEETIRYIDGESHEDTKARAVGAVGMLGYWPKLRRAMAEERRLVEAGKGEWPNNRAAGVELRRTTERLVEKALSTPPKIILPPGARDGRKGIVDHTNLGGPDQDRRDP